MPRTRSTSPGSSADAGLVDRALSGDRSAFESLILRYQPKAFAVALSSGVRHDSAPDVVQESFLRAFRSLPGLESHASFGAWFLSIVRNVARRSLSRRVERTASEDEASFSESPAGASVDSVDPARQFAQRDFSARLWAEVERLPDGVREAVFLYYYEGESVRHVASTLETTTSAVKNRLQKGRDLLRERLWRELGSTLRDMLPSTREWKRRSRRLSLVVMTSLPAGWGTLEAAASGLTAAAQSGTGTSSLAALATSTPGVVVMTTKHVALTAAVCGLLFWLGFFVTSDDRSVARTSTAPDSRFQRSTEREETRTESVSRAESNAPRIVDAEPLSPRLQPDPPEPPELGAVRVHVVSDAGDEPLPGIGLAVRRRDTSPRLVSFFGVTDDSGVAVIPGIPPGPVEVLVDRGSPRDVRASRFSVARGETKEILLRLRRGIRVNGIVVDASERPVAGAEVRVSIRPFDGIDGTTITHSAADGTFSIDGVEDGRYVSARAEGWASSSQHGLSVDGGSTVDLRLVLPGVGGTLSGRVSDSDGEPVAGALVVVGSRELDHGTYMLRAAPVTVQTNEDGRFEASGLPGGETPVAVRARGFAPTEVIVDVAPGRTSDSTVSLALGAVITGVVYGSDGNVVPRAHVAVGVEPWEHSFGPPDILATRTRADENGKYWLEDLSPGTATVAASARNVGKVRVDVDVPAGEVVELDIDLAHSLTIRGRVVLEDGSPVDDWMVGAVGTTTRFTDANGEFVLRDLDDRVYEIHVTEEGHRMACATVDARPSTEPLTITILETQRARSFISGTIYDAGGSRLRGATIQCRGEGLTAHTQTKSGFFGGFRLGPVPAGTYRLGAAADGYPFQWFAEVEVAARDTVAAGNLRFRRPGVASVSFHSSTGQSPEGWLLSTKDADGRFVSTVRLSSDPRREVKVTAGKATVVVRREGLEVVREIEVREGRSIAVDIDLDEATEAKP